MSASKKADENLFVRLTGSPNISEIRKSSKDVASYMTPNKSNRSTNQVHMNMNA
jgi:hypothetical protein